MNKIELTGRVGNVKCIVSGGCSIAKINLAVARRFKKEITDWFDITVLGDSVEKFIKPYVQIGDLIGIVGRLQKNEYETENGEKKYSIQIIVEDIEILSKKSNTNIENDQSQESVKNGSNTNEENLQPIDEDDLPF